jgi:hypothetical protein
LIWNLFWREAIKSSIKLVEWIRVFATANRVLESIEQTLDLHKAPERYWTHMWRGETKMIA